ncbi:unnamed protein product [Haemonchus placei]|uniref:ZU5 domain-containing protein n=1 Tax=Haemonchus placei TaxID=6290 RepID=A0A158QQI3_HAEPC|nr:unnamed protein product [Haemonchus placei]
MPSVVKPTMMFPVCVGIIPGYRVRPDDPYCEEVKRNVPDYENLSEMTDYSDTISRIMAPDESIMILKQQSGLIDTQQPSPRSKILRRKSSRKEKDIISPLPMVITPPVLLNRTKSCSLCCRERSTAFLTADDWTDESEYVIQVEEKGYLLKEGIDGEQKWYPCGATFPMSLSVPKVGKTVGIRGLVSMVVAAAPFGRKGVLSGSLPVMKVLVYMLSYECLVTPVPRRGPPVSSDPIYADLTVVAPALSHRDVLEH